MGFFDKRSKAADVNELESALSQGATLVDVRERHEFSGGHVPGAVLIPLGELERKVNQIKADDEVYVICASGGRSSSAVRFLESKGIPAKNVSGGMSAWKRAGKPVNRGNGA